MNTYCYKCPNCGEESWHWGKAPAPAKLFRECGSYLRETEEEFLFCKELPVLVTKETAAQ